MVVWCRVKTKKCSVSSKEENCPFAPMQTRAHAHTPLTPLNPARITDHRASSVHFNILFIRVYRCALLERWCAHEPVESHTSESTMATVCHCCACKSYLTTWGRGVIWKM